jgi:TnpA family transposase
MVVRKHFEAMVFTYLAEELRTGDIAVTDAGEYADWRANLLPWDECEPLLEQFCSDTGLPATAEGFVARLRNAHLDAAAVLDAGYEDNADLVIGADGAPSLKRRRSAGTPAAAERLKEAVERRMPERSLLSIVARTAYWLGWHHHFGPASGSDPKIDDPLSRYCMAVFTGGVNIGPYEAARHIAGVSARELSMVRNRHIDVRKLNSAIATVVNAFNELDVVKAWGDGTAVAVAVDGTQVETYIDNLLAETSIRYGGVGGIAYHYISDTYVALFSRFIPCGVWEAVHLIEGLLENKSDIQPSTIHADTQGQSAPVFALATLFGFDLMPRIRNFKDLIFYRPSERLIYPHIDELFGEKGRNVIDWKLIERHWRDLMQVAISISAGRLSSATLMRRLRSNSRKNRIYRVFREVGRSVRTVALLRCSFGADQVAHPGHLHARDTTLAFASRAPQAEIRRLKERHGWNHIPWYTITDDFDKDFDVDEWHGTNAFIREGDRVFRTYFIDNRGDEQMGSTWNCLDITALGRQETWEDSPEGYPQTPPYQWWNYHDAHDAAE